METLKRLWNQLARWSAPLFPQRKIFARDIPLTGQVALLAGLTLVFAVAAAFMPVGQMIGFDWVNVFSQRGVPDFYPPWGNLVVRLLNWPLLTGLSLAGVCLAVLKRAVHPLSVPLALLALPLLWTIFLGQLEGLITLGLLGLPWLAPLALLKPQVSVFAFGARRSYLVAGFIVLVVSLLLWGPWPLQMLATNQHYGEGRYPQDISLGWWGLLVAVPLLWLSRGDMDMLMLAGAFMTLHLIPYNLLPAVPAIARLRPGAALVAAALSWLPFSANWLGPAGWWLGWVFVGYLWLALAAQRYPLARVKQWLRRAPDLTPG